MKRALISVHDKTGIVEMARELERLGWEIVSTGGTFRSLSQAGVKVREVAELTGFPECLDGRVKTLHPFVHGGILAIRDKDEHRQAVRELGIPTIDLVVCNLYPFKQTLLDPKSSPEDIIENIDIGGPTMIRAAAKNHAFVTVLTDPDDYAAVLGELRAHGQTQAPTRARLAAKVFAHTAHYDSLVAQHMAEVAGLDDAKTISLTFERRQDLRYGENPHQKASFYTQVGREKGTLAEARFLNGKELSFNNINDTNGALETLKEFDEPTVVAVKHANPCGVGSAPSLLEAYQKAYEADTVSIFGGIVVANRPIEEDVALEMGKIFLEVIVAPSFSPQALAVLSKKKNLRLLELPNIGQPYVGGLNVRSVMGGLLVQQTNDLLLTEGLVVPTRRQPSAAEWQDLRFAWKVVKHVKSNGIVMAKGLATTGIGPGQVSRIWALENAIRQAGGSASGSVLASDAFFPFDDSVRAAAAAGVTALIQPGGSIRDKESIEAADANGMAMVFTQMRHFKH